MELPDFFGLDIGTHSVKLTQSKRRGETEAQLIHIGSTPTQTSLAESISEQSMAELADKIKEAHKSAGIKTVNCVAGIPEAPVFSRLLTLPKIEEDKMDDAVHWELKPLIPVPVSDVDIAFLEIGERDLGGQPAVDIFAVAAPKALTQRYKQVIEMAGLNLLALETEALANTRAVTFNHRPDEHDFMIFDFGAFTTDLIVARDGVPVFTQSISTGSDALTKAIAADYGIDTDQAEKYKRAFGLDTSQGDGKIATSIMPIMQILITEMQRTLTYYREKLNDTGTKHVYMCGEAAKLPGLSQFVKDNIGLECTLVDPIQALKLTGTAEKDLQQLSPTGFSVSIGLSLKDS